MSKITVDLITGKEYLFNYNGEGEQGVSGVTPTLKFTGDAVVDYNRVGQTYNIEVSGKTGGVGEKGDAGINGIVSGLKLWFSDEISAFDKPVITKSTISFRYIATGLDTIEITGDNWNTLGIMAGRKINISGATNNENNGIKWVKKVTDTVLTLTSSGGLVNEDAGNEITIASYRRKLTLEPSCNIEKTLNVVSTGIDGEVSIGNFVSEANAISTTRIPAGVWTFQGYFYLNDGGNGYASAKVKFQIRKVDTNGFATIIDDTAWTWITKKGINNAQEVTQQLVIPSNPLATKYDLNSTDRIVVRVVTQNTEVEGLNRQMNFIYQGTTRPAYVVTTFDDGSDTKADKLVTINNITGTTFSVASDYSNEIVELSNVGNVTVMLPSDLDTGFQCKFVNTGGGTITFDTDTNGVIRSIDNKKSLTSIYGVVTSYWDGVNITLNGDLI